MEQNNTSRLYLIIGLTSIILLLLNSCGTAERNGIGAEFKIINKTNYNIVFNANEPALEDYNVGANSVKVFTLSQYAERKVKKALPSDYYSPFMLVGRTELLIKFNNKCLIMKRTDDGNNILDISKFVAEKLGDLDYRFTFTFTEADYNRAVTCP